MADKKLLKTNLREEKQHAYGAFFDNNGTTVEIDEEVGLLESPKLIERNVYLKDSYQRSFSDREPAFTRGSGHRKISVPTKKEKKLEKAKEINSDEGSQESGTHGSYYLWGHAQSDNESSTSSGSSDELFSRGSASTNGSSHTCHDRVPRGATLEDRTALCKLSAASVISLGFMVAEFIGGYYASSLAIFSDAGHLLSDFVGFAVSLVALCVTEKSPNMSMNFGYLRAEILGSLACVLMVWLVTGLLVYAAILRVINDDYIINGDVMVIIAAIGVFVNALIAIILHGCGCSGYFHGTRGRNGGKVIDKENINIRAAFLHIVGDMIMSLGVLIAALIIKFYPQYKIADPILTFLFGIVVMLVTIPILKDLTHVLMEGFPKNISFIHLLDDLEGIPGVRTVHDLHVWSLTIDKCALDVHISVDPSFSNDMVLTSAQKLVREKYRIYHSTIQVEPYHQEMDSCKQCQSFSSYKAS